MTIVLLPDLALPIWEFSSYQPPSGYLSITWSASGGSARDLRRQQAQGVPSSPKSCLPSATGLGTFGLCPKAAGTFRGPLPPFLRAASPYSSFRAKKPTRSPTGAVCCSCITLPVSTGVSPTRRGNRNGFPGSKYSAPAPCRSGCRGEAPCSLRSAAKSPRDVISGRVRSPEPRCPAAAAPAVPA